VFVAALWICQALGVIRASNFLVFYTTICAIVSAALWIGMRWRESRARGQREACIRLLSMIQIDDEALLSSKNER
jgi:hypothetical protein